MKKIDLFAGYEGELEVLIEERMFHQKVVFELRVLSYDLDEILLKIPLREYHVDSVMYNFQRADGWKEDLWECKRIQEFYDQLVSLNMSPGDKHYAVFAAVKEIFGSAIAHGNTIFMDAI